MKRYLLCTILLLSAFCATAQIAMNMSLLGQWDDNSLPLRYDGAYMDIWGYAANGREYAIISTVQSVYFFDVTNPSNITEIDHFDGGADAGWRDIKTFGNYAYAVADEGNEGMMIFDLSNLPTSVTKVAQLNSLFGQAHNIFIDEPNGRLYAVGTNTLGNGMWVFDVGANPVNPPLLSAVGLAGGYVHDVYVRDNIAYCSHLNTGLYIYDFTNPNLPQLIGELDDYATSLGLNHSSWLNSAGTHLVFAEETYGRPLYIADITNLSSMEVTDEFSSALLAPNHTNSIAHNPFVLGDLCFVSYYHDGVHVFDISDPNNVIRVAYYDTFTDHSDYFYFYGAWGVYPYLPSGKILVSDLLNGLYVLQLEPIVLPVSWVSFAAKRHQGQVQLDWVTAAERDNAGFWVQRRTETGTFQDLFFVPAQESASEQRSYQAFDDNPFSGKSYYRLRQVDLDGAQNYSTIVSLEGQESTTVNWQLSPNQASPGSSLRLDGPVEDISVLEWIDVSGQVLQQISTVSNQVVVPKRFAAGTYYLRMQMQDGSVDVLEVVLY